MKLSELMQNFTPSQSYEGWVTNDDFVLAVDCSAEGKAASVGDYAVVEMGVTGLDSNLNPVTQDKTYIRAGQSTFKTGNQRSFTISGDRYIGDEFQDFVFSHAIKYGKGNGVIRNYVYFNVLNGMGEQGSITIIVNSDGSGDADNTAEIDVELRKTGAAPKEYTYTGVQTANTTKDA